LGRDKEKPARKKRARLRRGKGEVREEAPNDRSLEKNEFFNANGGRHQGGKAPPPAGGEEKATEDNGLFSTSGGIQKPAFNRREGGRPPEEKSTERKTLIIEREKVQSGKKRLPQRQNSGSKRKRKNRHEGRAESLTGEGPLGSR